jgi:hypothetical protein
MEHLRDGQGKVDLLVVLLVDRDVQRVVGPRCKTERIDVLAHQMDHLTILLKGPMPIDREREDPKVHLQDLRQVEIVHSRLAIPNVLSSMPWNLMPMVTESWIVRN